MLGVRRHKDPIELWELRRKSRFAYRFLVESTVKELEDEQSQLQKGSKPAEDPKARIGRQR
jgi:hypothetical protein